MIRHHCFVVFAVLLLASGTARAEWTFAAGGTYLSGLTDLADTLEENLEDRGFEVDTLVIPIGASFQGYTEWDSGLGLGFSLGPAMAAFGDIDFFNIPVGVDARYSFSSDGNRPYVRLGARYHAAGGDDIESGGVGPFAALGYEFWKPGATTGWALELAYDGAETEVISTRSVSGTEDIKAAEIMLSVFVLF